MAVEVPIDLIMLYAFVLLKECRSVGVPHGI